MTPPTVSGIAQALPTVPAANQGASPQQDGTAGAVVALSKDAAPAPVDKVSLSDQSRQGGSEMTKEQALIEETRKQQLKREETDKVNNGVKSGSASAKVQFVYDLKGEMSVRYMDSAERLIYQVPSELMIRMKEAASKYVSSVDMRA